MTHINLPLCIALLTLSMGCLPDGAGVAPVTASTPATVEVATAPVPALGDHVPDVRWLGGRSDVVVVDSLWTWKTGEKLEPLGLPPKTTPEFSWSGAQMAAIGDEGVWVGPAGGPLAGPVAVDIWVTGDSGSDEPLSPEDVTNTFFWLDDSHLFAQQMTPYLGTDPACRVLDVAAGTWSKPVPCITAEMYQIYAIEPGPQNLIIIHSVGEGHPAVEVATYSLDSGQAAVVTPPFDLYPSGPAQATLGSKGETLHIASPCLFGDKDRPCYEIGDDRPWRWFKVGLPGTSFGPGGEDLPVGFAPAPDGSAMAFGRPGEVCVSSVSAAADVTCTAVEKRPDVAR